MVEACSWDAIAVEALLTLIGQRYCSYFINVFKPASLLFYLLKHKQFTVSAMVSRETCQDTNLLMLFVAIGCNSPFTTVNLLCANAAVCVCVCVLCYPGQCFP